MRSVLRTRTLGAISVLLLLALVLLLPAVTSARGVAVIRDPNSPLVGSVGNGDGGMQRAAPDTMYFPGGGTGGSGPDHGGNGGHGDGDPDDYDFRVMRLLIELFTARVLL